MISASPTAEPYATDMAEREQLGIQETRDKFRQRVDTAIEQGVHTVVARHGRSVVALVPIEWYRRASEALEDPTEY